MGSLEVIRPAFMTGCAHHACLHADFARCRRQIRRL